MKGVLDHCLLALVERRPRYGFELIRGLEETELLTVGDGTIYPLLYRMHHAGLVEVCEVRSEQTGRKRRYYSITVEGERTLREWNRQWAVFTGRVDRVLFGHPAGE